MWRFFILQHAVALKPNISVDLACNTQICQNFFQLYVQFILAKYSNYQKLTALPS